jgi:type II secretory pathway predicted ATPase ExeA
MYEAFFRLHRRPFSATPDTTCVFDTESRSQSIRRLVAAVESEQGIGVLIGPAGVGKSLALAGLMELFRERFTVVKSSSAGLSSARSLLQGLLYELGERYTGLDENECRLELKACLKRLVQSQRPVVLLVDEGEQLPAPLFQELRNLVEETEQGRRLIRLIIAGQPALEDQLLDPSVSAFHQRIAVQEYLSPLSQEESTAYVLFRLRRAGALDDSLVAPEALQLIAQTSDGLPRCLSQLCDHALLLAFVVEVPQVTRRHVEEALIDLKQLPLHWNSNATSNATQSLAENSLPPEAAPEPLTNAVAFEFGADEPELASRNPVSALVETAGHEASTLKTDPVLALPGVAFTATSTHSEMLGVTVTTNVTEADLQPAQEIDAEIAARLDAFTEQAPPMMTSLRGQFPVSEEWSLSGSTSLSEFQQEGLSLEEPRRDRPLEVSAPETYESEPVSDAWNAKPGDLVQAYDAVESQPDVSALPSVSSLELEVDSPAVLSFESDVSPASTSRSDATFTARNIDRQFADQEPIFDRYAALDAGRTDLPASEPEPVIERRAGKTAASGRGRTTSRPDVTMDHILSLVAQAESDDWSETEDELDAVVSATMAANPTVAFPMGSAVEPLAPTPVALGGDPSTENVLLEEQVLRTTEALLAEVNRRPGTPIRENPTPLPSRTPRQELPQNEEEEPEYDIVESVDRDPSTARGAIPNLPQMERQPLFSRPGGSTSGGSGPSLSGTGGAAARVHAKSAVPTERWSQGTYELAAKTTTESDLESASEPAGDRGTTIPPSKYKWLFSMLRRKLRRSA